MSYLSRVLRLNLGHSLARFDSSIVFVPNVLIEMPAYTNSFIVIPARLLHALASQSDLHTSKST